jgi:hypothetical protein
MNQFAQLPEGARYYVDPNYYYPNHKAVDQYHHYKEDIALFAEMGYKVYRMSISWSRLFPKGIEETPNEEGVEHYRNVFKELRKYDIEPLVTMFHFDLPDALEKMGGWSRRDIVDDFVDIALPETVFAADNIPCLLGNILTDNCFQLRNLSHAANGAVIFPGIEKHQNQADNDGKHQYQHQAVT